MRQRMWLCWRNAETNNSMPGTDLDAPGAELNLNLADMDRVCWTAEPEPVPPPDWQLAPGSETAHPHRPHVSSMATTWAVLLPSRGPDSVLGPPSVLAGFTAFLALGAFLAGVVSLVGSAAAGATPGTCAPPSATGSATAGCSGASAA